MMKIILAFFLLLGLTILINAQQITLTGVVYDERGEIMDKITVKLVNKSKQEFVTTVSDKGVFEIKVPLGDYKISFTSSGFHPLIINNY